jgi:hypothetical protein
MHGVVSANLKFTHQRTPLSRAIRGLVPANKHACRTASAYAPALHGIFIWGVHGKPFQWKPMMFVPMLFLSGYMNIVGFKIDSAGLTGAVGGMYALTGLRRRQQKWLSVRGVSRMAAIGIGAVNMAACGSVYLTGDRKAEREEMEERDRWGIHQK